MFLKQVQKQHSKTTETHQPDTQETPKLTDDKLNEDIDGILDEIDEVLEEHAEAFVRNYVQKDGQ